VPERVLTQRELNRAVLARQLLLKRARLPLTEALERVAGLQAQYAPSSYVRLWSSLEGFWREDLTRALEHRQVVQGTLMRSTIHLVSARDYWPFAEAIRRDQRDWWDRTHRRFVGEVDMKRADRLVAKALADGPRRRDELLEVVRPLAPERATFVWQGVGLDLVRVPPSGTWERRRADLYATADSWIGKACVREPDAHDHVLRRYLGAFGPSRLADAAKWAGVNVKTLRPSTERVRLRRFRDEEGKELLDLAETPLPPAETRAPVRFLPTWDSTLLVHVRRTLILPEEYRPLLFTTKNPQSLATFLVDGSVAGSWRVDRANDRATLELSPFAPLPRRVAAELRAEGEALVRFHEPDATTHAVRTR
jgi:hypothetical protein